MDPLIFVCLVDFHIREKDLDPLINSERSRSGEASSVGARGVGMIESIWCFVQFTTACVVCVLDTIAGKRVGSARILAFLESEEFGDCEDSIRSLASLTATSGQDFNTVVNWLCCWTLCR